MTKPPFLRRERLHGAVNFPALQRDDAVGAPVADGAGVHDPERAVPVDERAMRMAEEQNLRPALARGIARVHRRALHAARMAVHHQDPHAAELDQTLGIVGVGPVAVAGDAGERNRREERPLPGILNYTILLTCATRIFLCVHDLPSHDFSQ